MVMLFPCVVHGPRAGGAQGASGKSIEVQAAEFLARNDAAAQQAAHHGNGASAPADALKAKGSEALVTVTADVSGPSSEKKGDKKKEPLNLAAAIQEQQLLLLNGSSQASGKGAPRNAAAGKLPDRAAAYAVKGGDSATPGGRPKPALRLDSDTASTTDFGRAGSRNGKSPVAAKCEGANAGDPGSIASSAGGSFGSSMG